MKKSSTCLFLKLLPIKVFQILCTYSKEPKRAGTADEADGLGRGRQHHRGGKTGLATTIRHKALLLPTAIDGDAENNNGSAPFCQISQKQEPIPIFAAGEIQTDYCAMLIGTSSHTKTIICTYRN
jgi:hypothetical protein